jgi:hypothetical protein
MVVGDRPQTSVKTLQMDETLAERSGNGSNGEHLQIGKEDSGNGDARDEMAKLVEQG